MSKARVAVLHVVSGQLSITDQQSEDNRLLFDSASEFVFGLHYPGAATPLVKNFEQWLSYLVESPPWLSPSAQVRNRAAFLDVSKAVETVMERRQLMMLLEQVGQERQGAEGCPRWLQRLVREWERYRTKVITFNYDQLVELAWLLYTKDIRGKSSDRSSSRDLYPVVLTPLTARGGHGSFKASSNSPSDFQLLKLHGSLGWYYSGLHGPRGDIVHDRGLRGDGWNAAAESPAAYAVSQPTSNPWLFRLPPSRVRTTAITFYGRCGRRRRCTSGMPRRW